MASRKVRVLLKIKGGKFRHYRILASNRHLYEKATPHRPRELSRKYKKRVRVYQKKKKIIVEPRYMVTVLSYTHETKVPNAWYIDLTKVTFEGTYSVAEQEKYCFEYLSRAFTKALKEGAVVSKNWGRDLPSSRYPPYSYTWDILNSMGIEFVTTMEDEGKGPEEIIYLWRANSGNRLKAGLRHKV